MDEIQVYGLDQFYRLLEERIPVPCKDWHKRTCGECGYWHYIVKGTIAVDQGCLRWGRERFHDSRACPAFEPIPKEEEA